MSYRNAILAGAVVCACSPILAQPIDLPPATIAPFTDFPTGAVVNVFEGSVIPLGVDLSNGELNIEGGEVAIGATGISTGFTNTGNLVTVSGGRIGPFFQVIASDLTVTGGEMDTFGLFTGAVATVDGGVVTGFPDVFSGSTFNLRGGEVNTIRALAGSTINIFGVAFEFDGVPVDGLIEGEPRLVSERDVTLTAFLADGNVFEWTLRPVDPGFPSPDVALPSATVSLILVPPVCPADVNGDGELTGADFNAWLAAFNDEDPIADQNGDGIFNGADFNSFLGNFNDGCG